MPKFIDETGNIYGHWKVLRRATKEETAGRKGGVYWLCQCDCKDKTKKVVAGFSLRNGESTSCGCVTKERMINIAEQRKLSGRINDINNNYQGCLMKIVNYDNANNIIVEFQDEYRTKIHASYKNFLSGNIKNPYFPEVYNIGMIGKKYNTRQNNKDIKEYKIWHSMLQRCYNNKIKEKQPTYKDVTCCEEWLLFENFYEWLHSQENFYKWLNGDRWCLDKDILVKRNKVDSPETCCLVPENINTLFTKRQNDRGKYPIGVYYYKQTKMFRSQCMNPYTNKRELIGEYNTPEESFYAYKNFKENLIKKIAQEEYENGNIIKKCYDAMMNYQVEITD